MYTELDLEWGMEVFNYVEFGLFEEQFSLIRKGLQLADIKLEDVYIAGGIFLEKSEDMDIFVTNKKIIEKVKNVLKILSDGEISVTKNACTYSFKGKKIQLVTKYVGKPEKVLKRFDFKQNSIFCLFKEEFIIGDYSFGTTDKNLTLLDNPFTKDNLITRLHKMLNKGFSIKKDELIKVMQMNTKEIKNSKKKKFTAKDFPMSGYGSKY